jgi:hypothetical protein
LPLDPAIVQVAVAAAIPPACAVVLMRYALVLVVERLPPLIDQLPELAVVQFVEMSFAPKLSLTIAQLEPQQHPGPSPNPASRM